MTLAEEMRAGKKIEMVAKWRASGLSQAEFCRREGLQQWELSEWKRFVATREKRSDGAPADAGRESKQKRARDSNKGRMKAIRRRSRLAPAATVAEPRPFVPVRLVDVYAGDGRPPTVSTGFECVLEVVLNRGQVVRVAPNCRPQFLSAVVSALDYVEF